MKKLISVVMTIAVLLSASQPVWAIEETDEVDAVAYFLRAGYNGN